MDTELESIDTLEEYLDTLAGHGFTTEETGNQGSTGWYGLFRFDDTETNHPLTENAAGAILYIDSQGFKDATLFFGDQELSDRWQLILEATEEEAEEE